MKAWDISEVKSLLAVTQKNDYSFYVLMLIAIFHGLRVSEACNLRKRDFVVIGGQMKLRVGRLKGSLETEQSLHHDADPLLDEDLVIQRYINQLHSDDLFFTMKNGTAMSRFHADREVKKYCALAGIDASRAHMHCAKHSLGMLLRKARRPIEEIAKALGHKNLNSTMVYMNVTDEDADFAREAAFATAAGGDK